MGLSSKQVSRDVGAGDGTGLGWSRSFLESGGLEFSKNDPQLVQQQQQQQQRSQMSQMTPLKCPRCDSMNTKFCYYNNYNQSQPRHFCKACKRHWTKGGMLRNVPVGGGRKNKRLRTTNTNNKSNRKCVNFTNHQHQQKHRQQHMINDCHALGRGTVLEPMTEETSREDIQMNQNQKNMSEFLNQAFISPTILEFVDNQNSLLVASDDDVSSSPVPNFNFTGLNSTFEKHPSSMSSSSSFAGGFQSSNLFNFIREETGDEDLTNPTTITTTSILLPPASTTLIPWQVPNTSSIFDSTTMTPPINWSWEDLNTLISTDLNQPWDDDGNQNK